MYLTSSGILAAAEAIGALSSPRSLSWNLREGVGEVVLRVSVRQPGLVDVEPREVLAVMPLT